MGPTDCITDRATGDIDIVIGQTDVTNVANRMLEFSRISDMLLVQVLQYSRTGRLCVFADIEESSIEFLHIDFSSDFSRGIRHVMSATEILESRAPARDSSGKLRGFEVASSAVEFAYYLLKKVDKLRLSNAHGNHLSAAWKNEPEEAQIQLERFWSGQELTVLSDAALTNDWRAVRDCLPGLRRALYSRLSFLNTREITDEMVVKLSRLLVPTGIHVVFLGTDGSGKSTVSKLVESTLSPAFRETASYHLRPRFATRLTPPSKVIVNPHEKRPHGVLLSIVKLGLMLWHYLLGWLLIVKPRLTRATLVVLDRYYHDMLVDPYRYRYGGPMWLVRQLAKLVPDPDLWMLLDSPTDVVQRRARELPVSESERQRREYLAMATWLDSFVVVDASQEASTVAWTVSSRILHFLAERQENRIRVG